MPRWHRLPERKVYRGQSSEHWPFGKWPVTVLWVFKPFYDTPAPDARNLPIMSDLKHVGRAAWPLLIRHVERANQTLVRHARPYHASASGRLSAYLVLQE